MLDNRLKVQYFVIHFGLRRYQLLHSIEWYHLYLREASLGFMSAPMFLQMQCAHTYPNLVENCDKMQSYFEQHGKGPNHDHQQLSSLK